MQQRDAKEQFFQEVFPAELEEIRKRRKRLNLHEIPPENQPTTRLELFGLALSAGGIRSATLSLGVIQALAKHDLLKTVDYLSTVSGGGFMGSCLSSLLNTPQTGPDKNRFPLHFEVGTPEPLATGHLRNSARYLAPGGLLDKLRIPALVLRGVLNSLFIFLLIIFLLVMATEILYEVGHHLHMPLDDFVVAGLTGFAFLAIGAPLIRRLWQGRSTWAQRNFGEMVFTLTLLMVMLLIFLVPVFIAIDRSVGHSWNELRENMTVNLQQPFEPGAYIQWLAALGILTVFMLAGRASERVSRLGGKLGLLALGLLGPAVLGLIYLGLLIMEVDSPFIMPTELVRLDSKHAEDLNELRVSPELMRRLKDNHIPLSMSADVISLQQDRHWLLRDRERAYNLLRDGDELSMYPDLQDALTRGKIPPELRLSLQRKGYLLDPTSNWPPEFRDNRFEINGFHRYRVHYDRGNEVWLLEQVLDAPAVIEALQYASYDLRITLSPAGVLIHNGVALSQYDTERAIRFVEKGSPHDIVLVVDNSTPPFANPEQFKRVFLEVLNEAIKDVQSTVHMAVFWFAEDVYRAAGFTPLTAENKQALLDRLRGDEQAPGGLDFQGRFSNSPAALLRALHELNTEGRAGSRRSIVFISDGVIEVNANGHDKALEDWLKLDFARSAENAGIRVFGIALSADAEFGLFQSLANNTVGAFYPVFETSNGVAFADVFAAMTMLKKAAGGQSAISAQQVSVTDQHSGAQYTLTRSKDGIRVRATVQDESLDPEDLPKLTDRWRKFLKQNGVELSEDFTVGHIGEDHWEILDPYRYLISRSGARLKVTVAEEPRGDGFFAWLGALIPPTTIWENGRVWVLRLVFVLLVVYWLVVDVNLTAAHQFYRDRLSRAFLFRVNKNGMVDYNDDQKLSELNTAGSAVPYHLINVALNLQGSKAADLHGRQSDFFIFSKRFTGSLRIGFLETKRMEQYDGNLDLGTAMAISGAAAAPNMGVTTVKPLVFIMTLLNIRLGYWLPNPRIADAPWWLTRLALRRGGPGPKYLLKEALGRVNDRGTYVNVSDGAHIEALGIYQLLQRHCKFIIAVDGCADPEMRFASLVKLQLHARIDLGIVIELDLDPLRKDANGLSSTQWALGKIHYARGEIGHLLYIKASVTGNEYEYVREYRLRNSAFPHESTASQFFNETQFEAYRALGYHIGEQLFENDKLLGAFAQLKKMAEAPFSAAGTADAGKPPNEAQSVLL